jgi:hypothetical protein
VRPATGHCAYISSRGGQVHDSRGWSARNGRIKTRRRFWYSATINKRWYLSFVTYQRYLTQIASCLHQAFGDDDVYGERIIQAVRAAPHFSRVHRRPRGATDEQVFKHLRQSWIKEIQLEHPLGDDTFLTELAQDSPRLAYYCALESFTPQPTEPSPRVPSGRSDLGTAYDR